MNIAGTYAYPNIGTSQWTRLSLVFGPSASFLTSGSSLSVGAWYGLFVSFSSDMGGRGLNGLDVFTDDAKGGLEVVGKQQWGVVMLEWENSSRIIAIESVEPSTGFETELVLCCSFFVVSSEP